MSTDTERFHRIAEHAADLLYETDLDGVITWMSSSAREFLGREPEELVGQPGLSLLCPEDVEKVRSLQWTLVAEGRPLIGVTSSPVRIVKADGLIREVAVRVSVLSERDGETPATIVSFRDITDEVRAVRALDHVARHDPLTDLLNRASIYEHLRRISSTPHGGDHRIAVAYCDMDFLRAINKTHGHRVGDEAIVIAAARLRGHLRATDVVGRVGGDEFIVILDGVRDLDEAVALTERLIKAHQAPLQIDGLEVAVTVSIGLTLLEPGEGIDNCIERADSAMFAAKDAGGARVVARPWEPA
jgi:diguanylate cyclase (GGDEF)-like protein/PAS domain S-box-containing protein